MKNYELYPLYPTNEMLAQDKNYIWNPSDECFVRKPSKPYINPDDLYDMEKAELEAEYQAWLEDEYLDSAYEEWKKEEEEQQALRKLEEIATVWNYGLQGGLL